MKQGLLHSAYVYHVLKPVPEDSNNHDAMDLWDAFEDWRSLPKITEREAACFVSSVGGQGIFTATAGEASTQTAAHTRKQTGYAAPVATGIASVARINMMSISGSCDGCVCS